MNADKDSKPYGYGFLLAEEGPNLTAVEQEIKSAFPSVFHLKTYRGQRNKLAKAREMLGLLPVTGHLYGGGLVQTDPAYARRILHEESSVLARNLSIPPDVQREAEHKILKVARLVATYAAVLCFPVIALLKAVDRPEDVVLDVQLGIVGQWRPV